MGKGGSVPGLFQAILRINSGLKAIPSSPSPGIWREGGEVRANLGVACAVCGPSIIKPAPPRVVFAAQQHKPVPGLHRNGKTEKQEGLGFTVVFSLMAFAGGEWTQT